MPPYVVARCILSKEEKLNQLFNKKPVPKDITFSDAKKYLKKHGFELKRTSGSHNTFIGYTKSKKKIMIVVPVVNGRYIKSGYVETINNAIREKEDL